MIIGIDLGTTTSEVAVFRNGKPTRLREVSGGQHGFLPSVVGIAPDGTLCVGSSAERLLLPHPDRAVAEAKRLMGSDAKVNLAGHEFSPQEISALLLKHLKQEAEKAFGTDVTEAVITVPAYFTNIQRQATRDAGELAGLVVRRLINEPTAAALAYGLERPNVEELIVVYDLGGGTLDVTLLELSEGVIDVVASTGNSQLGGKEFDERLMVFLARQCQVATGIDMLRTPGLRQNLKTAAKRAKEDLSSDTQTLVALPNIGVGAGGEPISFTYMLTRAAFEAQIDDLVSSTLAQLDEALRVKGTRAADVGTVLLVGGSTRIPLVRQFVSSYFGGRSLRTEVDPDEAVSLGAAVLAAMESQTLAPETLVITDVAPHTLGVAVARDDEAGELVTGLFDPLIQKQSTIPRTARKRYQTIRDNQDSVHVEVYQGDSELATDNEPVGDFVLDGLPAASAGAVIEIEFSYNLSGELEVVARAPQWRLERRVLMRPSSRHLSTSDKADAKRRLERLWTQPLPTGASPAPEAARSALNGEPLWRTARQYSRVAALMTHAERRLPTLDADQAARVAVLIRSLRSALEADDEHGVEQSERALTDLLFDLA